MKCRLDKNDELVELFSLGNIYISDFIPKDGESSTYGEKTPLKMMLSKSSGLVQLEDTADFDKMYKRYWYHSGTNKTMTLELKSIVESIQQLHKFRKFSDVEKKSWIDIGCNDGTLLKHVPKGFKKVGFDPAENNCRNAYEYTPYIINDYFSKEGYEALTKLGLPEKADVITSIAMFYDLPDPAAFCRDIYDCLQDDGLWVIQMSYLPLMLDQLAFDNICHEHLEYYSLEALKFLLEKENFNIVDCQLNDINGGSFRIYVQKDIAKTTSFGSSPYRSVAKMRIQALLEKEKSMNLKEESIYLEFFKKVEDLKQQTVDFIEQEMKKGKKIGAYGASTKGNTLLQYFGLTNEHIKYIAERQPMKYGLKTIGTEIPIISEETMREWNPDYMLVLPWHFINEFVERERVFLQQGGRFIIPCPHFEIIGD